MAPIQSKRLSAANWVVFGTTSHDRTNARIERGTLTQNIQRQPSVPSSTPPAVGPKAKPIAWVAAMIPSALPRRSGPAAVTRMTTLFAPVMAAPIPRSTRSAIMDPSVGASPHSADRTAKLAKPLRKMDLRPAISAKRAKMGSAHAMASIYPTATQLTALSEASNAVSSEGMASWTMLASNCPMKPPRHAEPTTSQG